MTKKIALILFFTYFNLHLYCQENIQNLIHKRDSAYSIYQKENPVIDKDSLSSKASKQLRSLKELMDQDNLIIDIVNDKVSVYAKDTAVTNKLTCEITKQNKELDEKNNMLTIFLIASIVASGLLVLFAILYLSSIGAKRKLKKEFELSALNVMSLESAKEDLVVKLKKSQNNYKSEYLTLKESCDKEMIRNKEIHRALLKEIEHLKGEIQIALNEKTQLSIKMTELSNKTNSESTNISDDEIERLKKELLNTTRFVHQVKEENAKIIAENDELKETLKTLSNISPELIEEMEFNFLKIERLTQLLIDGVISEEEFDEKRKMLLDEF